MRLPEAITGRWEVSSLLNRLADHESFASTPAARPATASDRHPRRFAGENLAVVPLGIGCEECSQLLVLAVLLGIGRVRAVVLLGIEDREHEPLPGNSFGLQGVVGDEAFHVRLALAQPLLLQRCDRSILTWLDLHANHRPVHGVLLAESAPVNSGPIQPASTGC